MGGPSSYLIEKSLHVEVASRAFIVPRRSDDPDLAFEFGSSMLRECEEAQRRKMIRDAEWGVWGKSFGAPYAKRPNGCRSFIRQP